MAKYTASLGNSYIKKEIIQNVSGGFSSSQKLPFIAVMYNSISL